MITLLATTLPLAARSSDEKGNSGWIFAIMVGIWILFSIVSAIAKKQDEARRKQVRERIAGLPPSNLPPANQPPPMLRRQPEMYQPQTQRPTIVQRQPVATSRKQAKAAKKRKAAARSAPPPVPVQAVQSAQQIVNAIIESDEPRSASASNQSRQAVSADSLNRWLRPATLRQQFILTEVLQPPVAMRPERFE